MRDLFKNKTFKYALIGFLAFVFIVLFLPIVFVNYSWFGLDYSETGQIGDTFGGITAPFIAIGAAFLTFLAFWVQYQANQKQWELILEERDLNNAITTLNIQKELIFKFIELTTPASINTQEQADIIKTRFYSIFVFFENHFKSNSKVISSLNPIYYSMLVFLGDSVFDMTIKFEYEKSKSVDNAKNDIYGIIISHLNKCSDDISTLIDDIIEKNNA
jgi:uncharacterized membrane protein